MSPTRDRSPTSAAATIRPPCTTRRRCDPAIGLVTSTTSPSARSGSPSTATSRPVARRRATLRLPSYVASSPRSTRASTSACSHAGGTKPVVRRRCSAQSPMACTRSSVTLREGVVDDHPAADHQAGPAGERGRRPAAGGEDDEVAGQDVAVVELQPVAGEPDGAGAGVDLGPEPSQVAGEHGPRAGADLAGEEVVGALDDLGEQPAHRQRPGDLQAEQAAADDDGPGRGGLSTSERPARGGLVQPTAVVEGAERVDARVEGAVAADQPADRRQGGDRAAGQDEPVEGDPLPVDEHDLAGLPVDLEHAGSEAQVDAVRRRTTPRTAGSARRRSGSPRGPPTAGCGCTGGLASSARTVTANRSSPARCSAQPDGGHPAADDHDPLGPLRHAATTEAPRTP